jgi:Shedu protein SduA, C-terminal
MTITSLEFEAFTAHVEESTAHRERECQAYLMHAAELLLPGSPTQIVGVPEDRNFFGETDLVICAAIKGDTNRTAKHAFIWELKAPQCHLFETDTKNRCHPTAAFLQGENQLLHYFHEASGNGRFRERMEVIDQDNIHIGGLVIGTRERMLKGSNEVQQAEMALRVREKYLYKAHGIRILTWDTILDFVRPIQSPSG